MHGLGRISQSKALSSWGLLWYTSKHREHKAGRKPQVFPSWEKSRTAVLWGSPAAGSVGIQELSWLGMGHLMCVFRGSLPPQCLL